MSEELPVGAPVSGPVTGEASLLGEAEVVAFGDDTRPSCAAGESLNSNEQPAALAIAHVSSNTLARRKAAATFMSISVSGALSSTRSPAGSQQGFRDAVYLTNSATNR